MTVTRLTHTDFAVVTDTVLADGSLRADGCMQLVGQELRSHEQPGDIRTGGLLRVKLGPVSLARVSALAIGESYAQ